VYPPATVTDNEVPRHLASRLFAHRVSIPVYTPATATATATEAGIIHAGSGLTLIAGCHWVDTGTYLRPMASASPPMRKHPAI
jgi:hypothetical protein